MEKIDGIEVTENQFRVYSAIAITSGSFEEISKLLDIPKSHVSYYCAQLSKRLKLYTTSNLIKHIHEKHKTEIL